MCEGEKNISELLIRYENSGMNKIILPKQEERCPAICCRFAKNI
jgi:hypothetical protein